MKAAIEAIPALNPGLSLFGRVVMPDHVHFNVSIAPGLAEPLKTLGFAIRRFKNHTTKLAKQSLAIRSGYGQLPSARAVPSSLPASPDGRTAFGQSTLWQQGYHDYLLVARAMIDATERYIAYNPLKWSLMHGGDRRLRIIEPLSSPRLELGDYWKGVGNLALLDSATPIVSLRVSREVADFSHLLEKMASAADKGYTIISGFISKGERAVRDMLCRRPGARFIRILPSCIPNRPFKPESVYVAPFAENRYLEIARGNDETEFGRAACLDLNAEIIEIATAGEGLALYWKKDGPHVLAKGGSFAPASHDG